MTESVRTKNTDKTFNLRQIAYLEHIFLHKICNNEILRAVYSRYTSRYMIVNKLFILNICQLRETIDTDIFLIVSDNNYMYNA